MDTVRSIDAKGLPTYTRAQVRRHCTEDDCWIIVDNGVYDVTEFFPNHPGGSEVLFAKVRSLTMDLLYGWLRACAKTQDSPSSLFRLQAGDDCTQEFYGDQHPDTVPTTLEQFLVGVLGD